MPNNSHIPSDRERWLNVYCNSHGYLYYGSSLYKTPKSARRLLADKTHYLHTINLETGEIVNAKLLNRKGE